MGKNKNPEPTPAIIGRPPVPKFCNGCGGTGNAGSWANYIAHDACNGTGWV